jgi:hypothetical protein
MKILKAHTIARLGTAVFAGALMCTLATGAHAQGGGGNNRITPEQRQQFMAQFEAQRAQAREDWQRQAMNSAGLTDAAAQGLVIEYEKKQSAAKTALLEKARALSTLIATPATPEATVKTELAAFRAAVAAHEKQQASDLEALDTQVKYSTSPRIEGLLTLLGILGNETKVLGGVGTIFPDSPYGNARGGMGRGQGQGGQGQGRGQGQGGQGRGQGRGQGAGGQGGNLAPGAAGGRNRNRVRNNNNAGAEAPANAPVQN